MPKLILENETYRILGACIKVHKKLGNGFSEAVYCDALAKELALSNIPFEQNKKLPVFYEGTQLDTLFVADFICYDTILLEIKSIGFVDRNMKQQVLKFLKSTNQKIGYLVNFGENNLTWKRYINH